MTISIIDIYILIIIDVRNAIYDENEIQIVRFLLAQSKSWTNNFWVSSLMLVIDFRDVTKGGRFMPMVVKCTQPAYNLTRVRSVMFKCA